MGEDDIVLTLEGTGVGGGAAYTAIAIGQVADDSLSAVIAEDEMQELPADD
jgi:F0F1-type ATP synthase membrane subunit c/vacuolar-type H+-ATPase subunit K